MAVVDPSAVPENRVPPPVVIEELVHDGTHASPAGGQVLPAGTRSVEIHYTGLSFTAPDRVRFRYRLEGVDPAWMEAGGRRTAYFTHLPPGSYRFRVSAANNDGVWNESGASLEFTIRPFFYQTAWFYAACAALAAAAAYGVYRLRTRQLEARYAAILAERSRIARELHDTIAQGFAGVSMHSRRCRRTWTDPRSRPARVSTGHGSRSGAASRTPAGRSGT